MKSKYIIVITLAVLWPVMSLFSQEVWTTIDSAEPAGAHIKVISSGEKSTSLSFHLNSYALRHIGNTTGVIPVAPESVRILKTGAPDLPCYAYSLIIDDQDEMEASVSDSKYIEISDVDVAPSKGNLLRTVNPSDIPFLKGAEYTTTASYPAQTVGLREPYILRDYRGQVLVINPIQYNPVSRVLRIYYDINIVVSSKGIPGINTLPKNVKNLAVNEEYASIYKNHFINYLPSLKYTPVSDLPGNMLVICYDGFMSEAQPLVDWKITKGIPCEMVAVSSIGNTSAAIKTFVTDYYNTHGLTYLLLVGDFAQVTSATASYSGVIGAKDNEYAYVLGNDHYAEFFVGRISAETTADVETQVQRFISYEKTPVSGTWYSNNIGIGSAQGPGDDNEYDYQHIRGLQTKLTGFTYTATVELFDGSQGGLDATGDPTAAMVSTVVNSGTGIINYCGHGSDNSWGTTGFSTTNAMALTNIHKLPFIYSVSCVIGHFNTGTCFCEGWMRSKQAEGPTGAIGIFGSTINQSWNPPMEAQDEMNDILTETYSSNIKRTYAGIAQNGCFKMNDTYADYDMTDTWTVFGDPSLVVRTKDPMTMNVSHPSALTVGMTSLAVTCDVEGAYVAVTLGNQILGTGYISGGTADVVLNPAPAVPSQSLTVCVTAFNYVPYIGSVDIVPSSTPYVIYIQSVIHDSGVNTNGLIEYGEQVSLDVTLKNVGTVDASNVNAAISTTSADIMLTDAGENYGDISAGNTVTINNGFSFAVNPVVADQTPLQFTLTANDGSGSQWQTNMNFIINAPVLQATVVSVNDDSGNGNGRLDAGENAIIGIITENNGHTVSPVPAVQLATTCPYVSIQNASQNINPVQNGSSVQALFSVQVDAGTPAGTVVSFTYLVDAGGYTATKTFALTVGMTVEDFESNGFATFPWNTTQYGNAPWTIINSGNIYEGNYTAQSGVIANSQSSDLYMQITVLTADTLSFFRKVSSEQDYDFLKFYIDGTLMDQWSGEADWSRIAYFLTSGTHLLKWSYVKDNYMVAGSDAAWIDFLVLPPIQQAVSAHSSEGIIERCSVFPNPVTSASLLQLQLNKPQTVKVELINSLGQCIRTIVPDLELPAGTHQLHLKMNETPGIYVCKLTVGTEVKYLKLFVNFRE